MSDDRDHVTTHELGCARCEVRRKFISGLLKLAPSRSSAATARARARSSRAARRRRPSPSCEGEGERKRGEYEIQSSSILLKSPFEARARMDWANADARDVVLAICGHWRLNVCKKNFLPPATHQPSQYASATSVTAISAMPSTKHAGTTSCCAAAPRRGPPRATSRASR